MNTQKQRVIAIDYFRGICILMVLINHAAIFTMPLPLLNGDGRLWTSAAEMFFLLSGITLWIVRGQKLASDFKAMTLKIWGRSLYIYLVYIATVLISLFIALSLSSHNLPIHMPGDLPAMAPSALLTRILNLSYTIGWANFLMYYTVFLLLAPVAIKVLHSRWWPIVPVISLSWYVITSLGLIAPNPFVTFPIWQAYFFLGLTVGRFRPAIISFYYGTRPKARRAIGFSVVGGAAFLLSAKLLWAPFTQRWAQHAFNMGWFTSMQHNYVWLMAHQPSMDFLLQNERFGLLRPAVALLTLAAAYLFYQRFKNILLKYTGNVVNTFGRETMWVFAGQAIAIPLLSSVPVVAPRPIYNLIMSAMLLTSMWLITQRRRLEVRFRQYMTELSEDFYEAKSAAAYRSEIDV